MIKRYSNVPVLSNKDSIKYRKNVIYPHVPVSENDFYVITTVGDRFDKLAFTYYNDSSLWWIIASSNPSAGIGLIPKPGVQLRIPADKQQALNLYRKLNS